MDDLEAIRQRKLRELQARQQQANASASQDEAAAEQESARHEAAVESLLQQILDSDARERLTRIRMSRPEFAQQVTSQLVALAQAGRLPGRLTDDHLRSILQQLTPHDRDIHITRK